MKEVRIALIGTGVISGQHMERYESLAHVTVVAACDIDEKKLTAFGEKYGVKDLYTDYRELLKRDDLDAVDVCLHNNLHVPMAIEVMKAGKHCYCEKPMAGSYADAKLLYDTAKKLGKELAIHLDWLFTSQSRYASRMIQKGQLGKVYHARSVGYRRLGRPGLDMPEPYFSRNFISGKWAGHGALYDMGVYRISQLLYVLGVPKLERVSGMTYQELPMNPVLLRENKMEVEELGVGLAKYENGLSLDIIESWAINMDDLGSCMVAGSKGGLRFCDDGNLTYFSYDGEQLLDTDLRVEDNHHMERLAHPELAYDDNDQANWAAFLAGELKERYDTPWLALQTMLVSEGIFLSGKLGREVTAEEIGALSVSNAVREQETPWGTFSYDF